jgi:hypothetical protein
MGRALVPKLIEKLVSCKNIPSYHRTLVCSQFWQSISNEPVCVMTRDLRHRYWPLSLVINVLSYLSIVDPILEVAAALRHWKIRWQRRSGKSKVNSSFRGLQWSLWVLIG